MTITHLLIDNFLGDELLSPEKIEQHKIQMIEERNKEIYSSLCKKLNKYIYKNFEKIKEYSKIINDNLDNNHEVFNYLLLSNILKKDETFFNDIIQEVNELIYKGLLDKLISDMLNNGYIFMIFKPFNQVNINDIIIKISG